MPPRVDPPKGLRCCRVLDRPLLFRSRGRCQNWKKSKERWSEENNVLIDIFDMNLYGFYNFGRRLQHIYTAPQTHECMDNSHRTIAWTIATWVPWFSVKKEVPTKTSWLKPTSLSILPFEVLVNIDNLAANLIVDRGFQKYSLDTEHKSLDKDCLTRHQCLLELCVVWHLLKNSTYCESSVICITD